MCHCRLTQTLLQTGHTSFKAFLSCTLLMCIRRFSNLFVLYPHKSHWYCFAFSSCMYFKCFPKASSSFRSFPQNSHVTLAFLGRSSSGILHFFSRKCLPM